MRPSNIFLIPIIFCNYPRPNSTILSILLTPPFHPGNTVEMPKQKNVQIQLLQVKSSFYEYIPLLDPPAQNNKPQPNRTKQGKITYHANRTS